MHLSDQFRERKQSMGMLNSTKRQLARNNPVALYFLILGISLFKQLQ